MGVLAPTSPAAAAAPTAPSQNLPADNERFDSGEPQVFSVTASDADLDPYRGRILYTPVGGGITESFDLAPAPSGQASVGTPPEPIDPGVYTWIARACEPAAATACGPDSGTRTFEVASPDVNDPPRAPVQNAPAHNKRFEVNEPQVFTVTATDDETDPYAGRVIVTYANGFEESFDLAPAPSGVQSTGTPAKPLGPGSYTWIAKACDGNTFSRCGLASTRRAFTVAAPPPNLPPGVPTLQSPADGHAFHEGDPQTFVVRAEDAERDDYVPTIEISQGGTPVRTRVGAPALSGTDASHTVEPGVGPGTYTWRARACQEDERSKCGSWSASRTFVVLVADRLPSLTALVSPEDGAVFAAGQPQLFQASGADEEGDPFVLRVRVRSRQPGETAVMEITSPSTASGTTATATTPAELPPGAYTWEAAACTVADTARCGGWSVPRDFGVASSLPNAAPGAVTLLSPGDGAMFEPGERQDFTVQASDPDGEPVTVELRFRRALDGAPVPQRVTAQVVGGQPTVAWPVEALAPGAYLVTAQAFDNRGGLGPKSESSIAVAAPGPATPCDGVEPLLDGWFGSHYLRLARVDGEGTGHACVRVSVDGQEAAGWVRAEHASTASAGTSAACPLPGGDPLPFPLLDTGEGPDRMRVWVRRVDGAATLCVRADVAGAPLVDTSVTLAPSSGGEPADLSWVPESPGSWAPPEPAAAPSGLPSSACQESADGTLDRVVNATVAGQRVWLHRLAGSEQQQTLCARVEGAHSAGFAMSVVDATGAVSLQVSRTPDDENAPCTVAALHENQPIVTRLAHTAPSADPAGVCLYAGSRVPAEAGLSVWLLADRSPGGTLPSVTPDP